jgi:signal transduction histidine kinase
VVKNRGRIGYVMLDSLGSSAQLEQGKTIGREEERNRIAKAFHDEVSSSMLAALFLVEAAKTELEDAGLPQAKLVAQASDILAETTEKIVAVVTDEADA